MVAEALIYRVIDLFGPPRQIICDEATEFSSAIIQAILCMLNCRLKVISPYNHGSSKCERQIQMISEIIMKHLWDKERTDVAFIRHDSRICNEYLRFRSIKWFITISITIS